MHCQDPFPPVGAADIPQALVVRTSQPQDAAPLVELDRVCFGRRAWTAREWLEVVGEPGWTALVAQLGDRVIAATVLLLWPPEVSLASLAVHPDFRRHGLGALLLRASLARARDARARWLELEVDAVNAEAVRLYRREGFAVSRRFREDGRARLGMVHRLGGRNGR